LTLSTLQVPRDLRFIGIVDDDDALCSSLVDLMRSAGYQAASFPTAERLLAFGNLPDLDCIIADVHMPGMGGLSLVRVLHEQAIATPVILITGLPQEHLNNQARSAGALCVLRKPFETHVLLDWVERSLPK
jgi:FixJ family two-component response regulator